MKSKHVTLILLSLSSSCTTVRGTSSGESGHDKATQDPKPLWVRATFDGVHFTHCYRTGLEPSRNGRGNRSVFQRVPALAFHIDFSPVENTPAPPPQRLRDVLNGEVSSMTRPWRSTLYIYDNIQGNLGVGFVSNGPPKLEQHCDGDLELITETKNEGEHGVNHGKQRSVYIAAWLIPHTFSRSLRQHLFPHSSPLHRNSRLPKDALEGLFTQRERYITDIKPHLSEPVSHEIKTPKEYKSRSRAYAETSAQTHEELIKWGNDFAEAWNQSNDTFGGSLADRATFYVVINELARRYFSLRHDAASSTGFAPDLSSKGFFETLSAAELSAQKIQLKHIVNFRALSSGTTNISKSLRNAICASGTAGEPTKATLVKGNPGNIEPFVAAPILDYYCRGHLPNNSTRTRITNLKRPSTTGSAPTSEFGALGTWVHKGEAQNLGYPFSKEDLNADRSDKRHLYYPDVSGVFGPIQVNGWGRESVNCKSSTTGLMTRELHIKNQKNGLWIHAQGETKNTQDPKPWVTHLTAHDEKPSHEVKCPSESTNKITLDHKNEPKKQIHTTATTLLDRMGLGGSEKGYHHALSGIFTALATIHGHNIPKPEVHFDPRTPVEDGELRTDTESLQPQDCFGAHQSARGAIQCLQAVARQKVRSTLERFPSFDDQIGAMLSYEYLAIDHEPIFNPTPCVGQQGKGSQEKRVVFWLVKPDEKAVKRWVITYEGAGASGPKKGQMFCADVDSPLDSPLDCPCQNPEPIMATQSDHQNLVDAVLKAMSPAYETGKVPDDHVSRIKKAVRRLFM